MPSSDKWVDWWQKEREIKALENIPSRGTANTSGSSPAKQSTSPSGCGAVLGLIFLIGGCVVLLQKGGCIASEASLRASTTIHTTTIETQEQKNLTFVHFSVKNGSKWPVSLKVRVDISKTAAPTVLLQNSVILLAILPHATKDERVAFELPRLREVGTIDLSDKDLCRISYAIDWITEAGQEPK